MISRQVLSPFPSAKARVAFFGPHHDIDDDKPVTPELAVLLLEAAAGFAAAVLDTAELLVLLPQAASSKAKLATPVATAALLKTPLRLLMLNFL